MSILLLILNIGILISSKEVFAESDISSSVDWTNDSDSVFPDQLHTDSVAVGIGRYLGYGYDVLYGDPFSAKLDSGLKRNSLLPPKVVQTFYEVNATCPQLGQCLHPHQSEVLEFTVYEKDHDSYRNAALDHISLYGKSTTNISTGFGVLSKRARETSLRLERGVLSVEHIRLTVSQESNLDFRQTKHLHPAFLAAICELPLEYHYDDYSNVLKEFGTHVVVRVRQALVHSNRTLVDSTMLRQTAKDLGVHMSETERNGVTGFDRTRIPTNLLQKAAERYGVPKVLSLVHELPVVAALREIPYFVTRERLAISESEAGECSNILRPVDAQETTIEKNVEQLRGNMERAVVEYVALSNEKYAKGSANATDGFVPWPEEPSRSTRKTAKHVCRDDFLSHSGKAHLLGVGYDIFRGDPFAPSQDPGIHSLPHLLDRRLKVPSSNATATDQQVSSPDVCTETIIPHTTKYRTQVWNTNDFVDEATKYYSFLDPLPGGIASLLAAKSSSMADARTSLYPGGQNLLSDLTSINASSEVLLNYRAVNGLASEFVHALCELPTTYQASPYVNVLKEFGTHIITKVRAGNMSYERVILQNADLVRNVLRDQQPKREKHSPIFDPDNLSTDEILSAVRRFIQQHDLDFSVELQQLPVRTRNNEPVLLTLRGVSYFVTPGRLASSIAPEERCAHLLQNETNVAILRTNLEKALVDYAEELRPIETPTTAVPTTTSTTSAVTSTTPITPVTSTTATTTSTSTTPVTTSTTSTTSTTTKLPVVNRSMVRLPEPDRKSTWPAGSYALLEPVEGCPNTRWERGSRLQDTEDEGHGNTWSLNFAEVTTSVISDGGVQLRFCVKPERFSGNEPEWPSGSYCMFKKGDCPRGFSTSYVHFDDEDFQNHNRFGGVLPDGTFGKDTRYYFCCRDDGNPFAPVQLPTNHPFIMMQNGFVCQNVMGMDVIPLWLQVDCENSRNGCHASTFGDSLPGIRKYNGDFRWNFCYYRRSSLRLRSLFDPSRTFLDYQ